MKKAIFLDRDGTLNIEKEYLYQEKDLEFEKGVIEALSIFRDLGYLLIVVTNQSGLLYRRGFGNISSSLSKKIIFFWIKNRQILLLSSSP